MDLLKLNKLVSDLAFSLEASAKYPKDLGSWGLDETKIEELKRHLSRLTVELKIFDINDEEFPEFTGKNLVEVEINSDNKSSQKAIDVLKRLKAFPIEEHHISNKKHVKESGYTPGHSGDPQYATPDVIHVNIPKDLFAIAFEDDEGNESDYKAINQKNEYKQTVIEDEWYDNGETDAMLKEFISDVERAVSSLLKDQDESDWTLLKLIIGEPFDEDKNPVSTLKIKKIDKKEIVNWVKKELPKAWDIFLKEVEFEGEDAAAYYKQRHEEDKADYYAENY